jgi:hypothetical protein
MTTGFPCPERRGMQSCSAPYGRLAIVMSDDVDLLALELVGAIGCRSSSDRLGRPEFLRGANNGGKTATWRFASGIAKSCAYPVPGVARRPRVDRAVVGDPAFPSEQQTVSRLIRAACGQGAKTRGLPAYPRFPGADASLLGANAKRSGHAKGPSTVSSLPGLDASGCVAPPAAEPAATLTRPSLSTPACAETQAWGAHLASAAWHPPGQGRVCAPRRRAVTDHGECGPVECSGASEQGGRRGLRDACQKGG